MLVAVHLASELESRAASALVSHPLIDRIALLGQRPPDSWGPRAVQADSAEGFEVVVGAGGADAARQAGAVLVVPGVAPNGGPAVTHASPLGLARALASSLGQGEGAITVPGEPARAGDPVAFPAPIGWARSADRSEGVLVAPVGGTLAAAVASGAEGRLGVVDDRLFLAAACLAAGVFLAEHSLDGPEAVWSRPDEYLAACQELGLVMGEVGSPPAS